MIEIEDNYSIKRATSEEIINQIADLVKSISLVHINEECTKCGKEAV